MHLEISNTFSDNILSFGGYDGGFLNSVEVHHNLGDSNNTTCKIQDLPKGLHGHSGVNTRLGVVYCGGYNIDEMFFSNDCYQLNPSNDSWVQYKPLKNYRRYFTMNEINDTLIAIGGDNDETSLEHVDLKNGKEWKQKQLGFSIYYHCSVVVDEKSILITGGVLNSKVRNDSNNRPLRFLRFHFAFFNLKSFNILMY